MRVLVSGGAGFVGANIGLALAERHPEWEIMALDNLHRRGSELNVPRLRTAGIEFIHGDVRVLDDLQVVGEVDAILECSAEPSALSGFDGHPGYVLDTNFRGAYHCLELARSRGAHLVFLSTSRVYPVPALSSLRLEEAETRFELSAEQPLPGVSPEGIAEEFPLQGFRTLYGASKLAAELVIDEYRHAYGLRAVINRCGVIAGPWQMGKVDQGVFSYWILAHHFKHPLRYIGFGGSGKQVRDLLHVEDLVELLDEQLLDPEGWDGATVNVGGGRASSLSLLETTALCAEITGHRVDVKTSGEARPGDVPVYISDCRALGRRSKWRPRRGPRAILEDIHAWVCAHEAALERTL
jgi:CDP-paratose 2-epimerase